MKIHQFFLYWKLPYDCEHFFFIQNISYAITLGFPFFLHFDSWDVLFNFYLTLFHPPMVPKSSPPHRVTLSRNGRRTYPWPDVAKLWLDGRFVVLWFAFCQQMLSLKLVWFFLIQQLSFLNNFRYKSHNRLDCFRLWNFFRCRYNHPSISSDSQFIHHAHLRPFDIQCRASNLDGCIIHQI